VIAASAATVLYVYGIVGADAADDVEREVASAALGQTPRLLRAGSLAALVSEVPLAEFGADVLPERLNDRDWLEERVQAHEDVLEAALARTTVIPFRFGAIYHGNGDVARMLGERRRELEEALERVRGRVELGVKAYVDRQLLEERLRSASREASSEGAGAGRAYLLGRQAERRVVAEADEACAAAIAEAHERLSAIAVDARVNRPQPRELSGRPEQMLLNGAYLVERGDSRIESEVESLRTAYRGLGIAFELTGPWPPYNFVDDEEAAA